MSPLKTLIFVSVNENHRRPQASPFGCWASGFTSHCKLKAIQSAKTLSQLVKPSTLNAFCLFGLLCLNWNRSFNQWFINHERPFTTQCHCSTSLEALNVLIDSIHPLRPSESFWAPSWLHWSCTCKRLSCDDRTRLPSFDIAESWHDVTLEAICRGSSCIHGTMAYHGIAHDTKKKHVDPCSIAANSEFVDVGTMSWRFNCREPWPGTVQTCPFQNLFRSVFIFSIFQYVSYVDFIYDIYVSYVNTIGDLPKPSESPLSPPYLRISKGTHKFMDSEVQWVAQPGASIFRVSWWWRQGWTLDECSVNIIDLKLWRSLVALIYVDPDCHLDTFMRTVYIIIIYIYHYIYIYISYIYICIHIIYIIYYPLPLVHTGDRVGLLWFAVPVLHASRELFQPGGASKAGDAHPCVYILSF